MEWFEVAFTGVLAFALLLLLNLYNSKSNELFNYKLAAEGRLKRARDEIEVHRAAVYILKDKLQEMGVEYPLLGTYKEAQKKVDEWNEIGDDIA